MITENNRIIRENGKIVQGLGVYQVSGLLFWHDASQLPLADNTPMSSIAEKAGSGFNFVQSDSRRRPVYRTNQINGYGSTSFIYNTVDFAVGNQGTLFGSKTGSQNFFNGRVVEFFWVGRFDALPTTLGQFFHIRANSGVPVVTMRILTTGRFSLNATDDASAIITTTLTNVLNPNQWYLFYVLVDFSGTFNRTVTVDGVGTTSATSSNSFTFTNGHNFRLGGSSNTAVVDVPESIITSNTAPLSANDRGIITGYLKSKYNI